MRQADLVTLERDRALAAVAHREAVDEFMSDLLLEAGATGKPVSIASLIARADTLSASEFEGNPEARAAVLKTVAQFKLEFDGPEKSLADFRRAGELLAGSRDVGLRASVACTEALLRGALAETTTARRTVQALAADDSVPVYTRSECYGDLAQLALFQYDSAGASDAAERALRLWDESRKAIAAAPAGTAYLPGRSAVIERRTRQSASPPHLARSGRCVASCGLPAC